MTRKFGWILFLSLLTFAFLAGSAFSMDDKEAVKKATLDEVLQKVDDHPNFPHGMANTMEKNRLMGGDDAGPGDPNAYFGDAPRSIGFEQRGTVAPGPGVGLTVGLTTYDYQHNGRTTRQVAWRGSHDIHIAWMKKNAANPVIGAGVRLTSYQFWNATTGALAWSATTSYGGDDLHASGERSGYCGVDAMSDGRGIPYNHYDPDGLSPYNYYPVVWPDQTKGAGNWSYKQGVPADQRTEDWAQGNGDWTWPYACFQLYDNGTFEDTVFHVVASESGSISNLVHRYFRRTGGPHPESPANGWTSMTFDSGQTITTIVEAAPPDAVGHEGKVAIVWAAFFGANDIPGNPESGYQEPISLLVEQNAQDVYMMTSDDAGVSWNGKYNVTKNDITVGGWWPYADLGAVIDTDGRLHIVWAARQQTNLTGLPGDPGDPQMDYPLFPMGSRIYHWSDNAEPIGIALDDNYITIVKDATADWTEFDSICIGGAWHSMALNIPHIGQCDDKLYVTFAQFQDVTNGIWDNCHITAWTQNITNGSANANLYFSVSPMSNGGLNWDPARLLTDFTPRCDTAETGNPSVPVDPTALNVCHSHFYNSMTRWGMHVDGGDDFTNAVVVNDGAWTQTSTDYYMDVFYVDDFWPGGLVQGEGMWAIDHIKWFRFPCVDAEEEPVLVVEPGAVFENTPSWTKPGTEKVYDVMMLNIGNTTLNMSSIDVVEIDNADISYNGWLVVDERGFGGTITEVVPGNSYEIGVKVNAGGLITETAVLEGKVTFNWDNGSQTVMPIGFIVADTVQGYEQDTIFTQHIGITVGNNGNYGGGLYDTCGRMDFHILGFLGLECDTCQSGPGNAEFKYLAEGAPFVVYEKGGTGTGDFRISTSVASHGSYSEVVDSDPPIRDGFRPQEGLPAEFDAGPFTYTESGVFYSADSTIGLKNTVYAPQTSADTANFFVLVTKYFNNSAAAINDLYVGEIEDWDIPSDTGSRNASSFDVNRKLMYMTGWETGAVDTFCGGITATQNNCVSSFDRAGGSAFFSGHEYNQTGSAVAMYKYEEPAGAFTFKIQNWMGQDVRSHIPAERLYDTLSDLFFGGYSPWTATSGTSDDSLYRDLAMITSQGAYNLGVLDTLTFVKFLASEYNGGVNGLQLTIDKARKFTLQYVCCRIWGLPGDVNLDHKIDILDIVALINFKYKGAAGVKWPSGTYDPLGTSGWPTDNCDNIMNVNAHQIVSNAIDILDIVYLINYKYKGGGTPTCRY